MGKYIIFGAGHDGKEALKHINKDDVDYFCDNNPDLVGQFIDGIEIISFEHLKKICDRYCVILAVGDKRYITVQFRENGITNYINYLSENHFVEPSLSTHNQDEKYYLQSSMTLRLNEFKEKESIIDTIFEYEKFTELVKECKVFLNGKYAFYPTKFDESLLYGHGKALMEYAGIPHEDVRNLPLVIHAPSFCGTHPYCKTGAIFSGIFDKAFHNKCFPYIPVYSVGPYIHYAKGIYSDEKVEEWKKRNGKTGLIFLTHSTEGSSSRLKMSDEMLLDEIMNIHRNNYDKLMVCAYWNDIDKEFYKTLNDKGIQIISAGFRFSDRFINRLKTILALADELIFYGFTSGIVYGMAMHKSIRFYDIEDKGVCYKDSIRHLLPQLTETKEYSTLISILGKKYGERPVELSKQENEMLNLHYGFDQMKTPEEIKMIYEISKRIWENCDYDEDKYPYGVYRTYHEYQKTYDFSKLCMLSQALGKGFWAQ